MECICSNCSEIMQGSNKCRFDACTASFCSKCWLRSCNELCTTHSQRKPDEQAFIEACEGGRIDQARQLLRSGANVNSQDSNGYTILMLACRNGHIDTARMLLGEFHANIDIQDEDGWTALMLACRFGKVDTARMLLGEFHANIDIQDELGGTALMRACENGHIDAARMLLGEFHANIDIQDELRSDEHTSEIQSR